MQLVFPMSAQSFLIKAIGSNGTPDLINIDKSSSNKSAINVYSKRTFTDIEIRQCKYLNNIIEQDHRFIKWHIRQGLGFKDFESARRTNQKAYNRIFKLEHHYRARAFLLFSF